MFFSVISCSLEVLSCREVIWFLSAYKTVAYSKVMVIMDNKEFVGSLEEQALKRKERLKNLKRKVPESSTSSNEIVPLPK